EAIKAIFDSSAVSARLFYNPDLPKLETEGASSSQLRLLGEEDDAEISMMPGNVGIYHVSAAGEDGANSFSITSVGDGTTSFGTATVNTESFKVTGVNHPFNAAVTVTAVGEDSSLETQTLPATQIKISAPVRP
ncbi:MAG: hypothetical protein PHG95_04105, partial [Patescibacteria group bacterium]|nr:hypothetical protein [Patescibacteria group bacterium]